MNKMNGVTDGIIKKIRS